MRANQLQSDAHQGSQSPQLPQEHTSFVLNNLQLLELISDDQKFISSIVNFNKTGMQHILNEDYDRALLYLQEAQKILEYAASCGKTIDRFLIISTLHNEACVYQKLWELEKSSDYMEAIIFNMSTYLDQMNPIEVTPQFLNLKQDAFQILSAYITRHLSTAIYHLQFSAVSSQIGKHQMAIQSTSQCLQLLHQILVAEYDYETVMNNRENKNSKIKALADRSLGIQKSTIPNLQSICRGKIKFLRANKHQSEGMKKLQNFAIGEVMSIDPITTQKASQITPMEVILENKNFTYLAIYVSIAYYATATEMRLLNNAETDITRKKQEIERSKIYHLNSIKIYLQFVPFLTEYLEHIIRSLKNNYQIDLNSQFADSNEKLNEQLIIGTQFDLQEQDEEQLQKKQDKIVSEISQPNYNVETFGHTFTVCKKSVEIQNSDIKPKNKQSKSKSKVKSHSSTSIPKFRQKIKFSKEFRNHPEQESKKKSCRKSPDKKSVLKKRQHSKIYCGNSNELTKDQSKKTDEKKNIDKDQKKITEEKKQRVKKVKRLTEEYLGTRGEEKKKKKDRRSMSSKKKNTLKSLSKGKNEFFKGSSKQTHRLKPI